MTEYIEKKLKLLSTMDKVPCQNEKRKQDQGMQNQPLIKFKGKITYIDNFIDAAIACEDMLKLVEVSKEYLAIGFDLEWPFSFQTGSGKVAVIQLCPNSNTCYIIHCTRFNRLPQSLNILLSHPKTRITGVNIKNDVRKLSRDFPGLNVEKTIENCIDSSSYANKILPFQKRWSMEGLVKYLLKMSINKDKKVRASKWDITPLLREQLEYAATDAYASLELFNELKRREIENSHM